MIRKYLFLLQFILVALSVFSQPMNMKANADKLDISIGNPDERNCHAEFNYIKIVSNPLTILFTDISTGSIVNWSWDFGDGETSNEQNPVHTFTEGGVYEVCFTIQTANNACVDTYCEDVFINQNMYECYADFWGYYIPGSYLMYQFKDYSYPYATAWDWDFGDGTTSTEQNPVHSFAESGVYEVCLTMFNEDLNCEDTKCYEFPVDTGNITNCNADFWWYQLEDFTVQFVDMSFPYPTTWFWEFGDGAVSEEQNPVHIYPDTGMYEVCLTMTNEEFNCEDTQCYEIWVEGGGFECMAMFIWYPAYEPFTIEFFDLSWFEPGTWLWEFGDGEISNEQNPVHNYAQPGVYEVCLTIQNADSTCVDTYCDEVLVNQNTYECIANFWGYQVPGSYLIYQFQDYSFPYATAWDWDFGDGTTSTEQNPVHSFAETGVYEVCLTMYNENLNCEDTQCYDFPVDTGNVQYECFAIFWWYQIEDLTIQFEDFSFPFPSTWFWEFGDGTFSEEQNPVHIYPEAGMYEVCLTMTNEEFNCEDTQCYEVWVEGGGFECMALFEWFPGSEPFTIEFVDLSLFEPGTWLWDFGDGNISQLQNPNHTYQNNGEYFVCLMIFDPFTYCEDIFCDTIEVSYTPTCEAFFEYDYIPGDPLSVQFIDMSIGNIDEWNWDFGDGNISELQNPIHTYSEEGTFNVCLIVTDLVGPCQDIYCAEVVIDVPELCQADFNYYQDPSNPFRFVFTDFSTGILNSWQWDFGDGAISEEQNPVHIYADTGVFQVCLFVSNPDSLIFCNSTFCDNLSVTVPVPQCNASFIAVVDSGINNPYYYYFNDGSTGPPDIWFWEFGDEATSSEQNPEHKYAGPGTYEVKLTITKLNPWGENCTDTYIQQLTTPDYYHVGGFVYAGNFPINNPTHNDDTANICIYRMNNDEIIPLDTNFFTELGHYYFLNLLESNYLIKVNLTKNSTNYNNYFPTHLGGYFHWQDALPMALYDSSQYNADVHLNEIPEIDNGIGIINGQVIHNFNKFFDGGPAYNTEIILFDKDNIPCLYTYSDDDGLFSFFDLPLGTYTLLAESAGLFTEPVTVVLSDLNTIINGLQLDLYDDGPTAIEELSVSSDFIIDIFPNPVIDKLQIRIVSSNEEKLVIQILNFVGQQIFSTTKNIQKGNTLFSISADTFVHGIYFIRISNEAGNIKESRKFIR